MLLTDNGFKRRGAVFTGRYYKILHSATKIAIFVEVEISEGWNVEKLAVNAVNKEKGGGYLKIDLSSFLYWEALFPVNSLKSLLKWLKLLKPLS